MARMKGVRHAMLGWCTISRSKAIPSSCHAGMSPPIPSPERELAWRILSAHKGAQRLFPLP